MPSFLKKTWELDYNCPMHAMNLPQPILVNTRVALRQLSNHLSSQSYIAVDTEANSLYAYREQVCLIQFSTPEKDYLVDPLALDDLSPLAPIFNHTRIEKIFHAAEYDLIILMRDFGFTFNTLFDTMVAARILGYKSVGLSATLKSQFGVHVNKKYQRANWGRRPLPLEMLTYAQLDTHYLIPLRDRLKTELESRNLWELAQEDFRRLCHTDHKNHQQSAASCWRINGVKDLSPKQVAVLHELCQFREQKAKQLDRPVFKVISDKSLVNIASARPETLNQLERIHGVSNKQVRWIGTELLAAVHQGLRKDPPPRPDHKRPPTQYLIRLDALRSWRKITARRMNVQSDVVLPRDLLYTLVERNPKTPDEVDEILQPVPWRRRKFGEEIFYLLRAAD